MAIYPITFYKRTGLKKIARTIMSCSNLVTAAVRQSVVSVCGEAPGAASDY